MHGSRFKLLGVLALVNLFTSSACYADGDGLPRIIYVSPIGLTNSPGLSVERPTSLQRASIIIRKQRTDIVIKLLSGTYSLKEPLKLLPVASNAELAVEGEGLVRFEAAGTRTFPAFEIGRSKVRISNLSASGFSSFVDTMEERQISNLAIERVDLSDMAIAINLTTKNGGAVVGAQIVQAKISRFTRAAVRLSGTTVSNILIANTHIDGSGIDMSEADCYRGGIQIYRGASNIRIEEASILNTASFCGKYHQGDGIEVSDEEAAPFGIRIANSTLAGNRDGNLDLKARDVLVERTMSRPGPGTRFSYRFWNFDYTCRNCAIESGSRIFMSNARVKFIEGIPRNFDGFVCAQGVQELLLKPSKSNSGMDVQCGRLR